MRTCQFISLAVLFYVLFMFSSCSKNFDRIETQEEQEIAVQQDKHKYQDVLNKMGFSTEDMQVGSELVIVQDDIVFTRKFLNSILDKGQGKAITIPLFVTENNIRDVAVFIAPGFTGGEITDIRTAMDRWENIQGCAMDFREVTTNGAADLTIAPDGNGLLPAQMQNLPNTTLGIAWFANNGVVGRWISMNTGVNHEDFTLTVQHEIGHAVGFAHGNQGGFSNISVFNENGQGGTHSASTLFCTSSHQTNNLMEGNSGGDPHNFSADEMKAARIMYPDNLLATSITRGNCNPRRGTASIKAFFPANNIPRQVTFQGLNSSGNVIWTKPGVTPCLWVGMSSVQSVGCSSLNSSQVRVTASNPSGNFTRVATF